MHLSATILPALGLATAVLARVNNVEVDTRSLDEIYEAAQKEDGKLVVLSGGDANSQGDGYRDGWAARFPNIALDFTVDVSKYHDSLIDRAFYAKNETVDVAILQTLHDFQRWKDQDRLLYHKPATFDDIYNGEKDLDGAFLPIAFFSFGDFVYDNTQVAASDVPTNYADLLDPKWKGKITATYPNDDDAVAYLFSIIIDRYGFEWLDALAQQDVQWVRGTATPSNHIVDNHFNVTSTNSTGRVLTFTTGGYSGRENATFLVRAAPVAPEQKMSWAQTVAAFASTKRPETSKLFISWLTSLERQTYKPSPLKSVDEGEYPSANNTQTSGFRQFMNDRQRVEWWKLQFETTLGSAQGPPPMVLYP